ncbi:MAG: metallophosphoesterase, partial [Ethanoligenens sp.]
MGNTMRFLHTADLHIGKRVGEYSLIEDQTYILSQILQIIDQEQPDSILLAGDIYDKSVP